MRVKIKSIEAILLDASTLEEDDFILDWWEVRFEVIPDKDSKFRDMTGKAYYRELPSIKDIIKEIKEFYERKGTPK